MKFPMRIQAPLAATALMALSVSPAFSAATINSDTSVTVNALGDSFGVNYVCSTTDDCGDAGSPDVDLTAMSSWEVITFDNTNNVVEFAVEIMNTSSDPNVDNRITQFGVKVITPDPATAAVDNSASTSDPNWDAQTDTNFPTFMLVDLIVSEDSTGAAGVKQGKSDDMRLSLSDFDPDDLSGGVTLEIFPIKYQGVGLNGESFEFAGTIKRQPVPVPATLGLLGVGLVGLGWIARRKVS